MEDTYCQCCLTQHKHSAPILTKKKMFSKIVCTPQATSMLTNYTTCESNTLLNFLAASLKKTYKYLKTSGAFSDTMLFKQQTYQSLNKTIHSEKVSPNMLIRSASSFSFMWTLYRIDQDLLAEKEYYIYTAMFSTAVTNRQTPSLCRSLHHSLQTP